VRRFCGAWIFAQHQRCIDLHRTTEISPKVGMNFAQERRTELLTAIKARFVPRR
jgi:hypothetical protein